MDLNKYLDSVRDAGWMDHIMPPESEDADEETRIDNVMRVELSLCFPLFTDGEKMVLLGAWWASKAVALGINLPRTEIEPDQLAPLEANTNSAEIIYMQARESVQTMCEHMPLTEAQRDFIDNEILHVPFL